MLLSNGQRGGVDPLVDLLSLPGLEGVETFTTVTHPAHNDSSGVSRIQNQHCLLDWTGLSLLSYLSESLTGIKTPFLSRLQPKQAIQFSN